MLQHLWLEENTEETAKVANKFALVDDVDACKAAVPGCGVTFKTGAEMQEMLTAFYNQILLRMRIF